MNKNAWVYCGISIAIGAVGFGLGWAWRKFEFYAHNKADESIEFSKNWSETLDKMIEEVEKSGQEITN